MASKKPKKPVPAPYSPQPRSVAERLQDAQDVLEDMTELIEGARDHPDDGRQLRGILRRFLNDGRTVTWTLQHLKSEMSAEAWAIWWPTVMREINTDPLSSFFYRLRNPAVKEGRVDLSTQLRVTEMNGRWISVPKGPDAPEPSAPPEAIMAYLSRAPEMTPGCEMVSYPMLHAAVEQRLELVGTPDPYAGHPIPQLMAHHVGRLSVVVGRCRARFDGAHA